MGNRTACLAASFALLSVAGPAAGNDHEPIPALLRGVWGKAGRCDIPADRLTITARTAGWGAGPFTPIVYDPGDKAIFWDQEYDVDNFVLGGSPDVLVHNTEGFHMPGQVGYARCGPAMARVSPWPPFTPGPLGPGPGGQPDHGASAR